MRTLLSVLLLSSALFGQSSNYPGSLDTDATIFVTADNLQTALSSAMLAGDTVAVVGTTTGWAANMIATVCDSQASSGKCTSWEHMLVTSITGSNILNVTRGFAGTSATAHAAGKNVSAAIDSVHQKSLKSAVLAIEGALGANLGNLPALPSATALQGIRKNAANTAFQGFTGPIVNTADYNFASLSPAGTLVNGNNSVTFPLVPLGLNGTDAGHYVWVAGTGTPEACLITGGAGTAGQTNVAIIINCGNSHSAGYTITSAIGGLGEAAQAACTSGGGEVRVPSGTITARAPFTAPCGNLSIKGIGGRDASVIQMAAGLTFTALMTFSAVNNISISGITFDGNFPNSTPAYSIGLYFNGVAGFEVEKCAFRYWGYTNAPVYNGTNYANTHSILMVSSRRGWIRSSTFHSNFGVDIQPQTSTDITIEDNDSGTPSVSDALTNVNWWDTQGSAPGFVFGGTANIKVRNNRLYGGIRFSDTWGKGGPIRLVNTAIYEIDGNIGNGLNAGFGTVSVTNGSGTVTGTNTFFSTLAGTSTNSDVQAVMMIEGDATTYHISAVASGTSITVTPTVARGSASGLRYQMAMSGDLVGCSPCYYGTISSNKGFYSGDQGLSLGQAGGSAAFQHNTIVGNTMLYGRVCGGVILDQAYDNVFVGNVFANNHQGTGIVAAGDRGGFCFSTTAGLAINNNTFSANRFYDDQGVATQLYAWDFDTGDLSDIINNFQEGNDFANVTLSNITGAQWNAIFSRPVFANTFIGANVASGTTIAPTGQMFHVTGTTAIATISLPAGFTQGCIQIVPDGLWTTTNAGNIAIASTAVVSKALQMCYDPGSAKWYPGY